MSEFCTEKLNLFPEKEAALREASEGKTDLSYPISVELSLTDRCMFNCIWCSDADLRHRNKGHMEEHTLMPLLEDLAAGGTKGITLEGGGESTMHPLIGQTISRIRELGMAAGLITNGATFHYRDHFDQLEWVRVSLDAANSEQMDKLKAKDVFKRIIGNIREMIRRRQETVIGISYIITKFNRDGLEEIISTLRDDGVNYIQLKPVVDNPEMALETGETFTHLKDLETPDFKVYLEAMSENAIMGNGSVPCVANSLAGVITSNGDVHLCGRLNIDPDWPVLGNVNYRTFKEIWESAERERQSLLMLDPETCKKHCPACRMTKYNLAMSQKTEPFRRQVDSKIKVKTPHFI